MIVGRDRRLTDSSSGVAAHARRIPAYSNVRTAPLVNRLVVVGNDAEMNRRLGQKGNQLLLGRVHVLVLVHDQVPQRPVDAGEHLGPVERLHRSRDEQPVGQEVVAEEGLLEGQVAVAERRALERGRVKQLVLHHVGVAEEVENRPPVLWTDLAEFQPFVFPAEQAGETVLVQDVEVAELRDVILKHVRQAVGVDGADEHRPEPGRGTPAP